MPRNDGSSGIIRVQPQTPTVDENEVFSTLRIDAETFDSSSNRSAYTGAEPDEIEENRGNVNSKFQAAEEDIVKRKQCDTVNLLRHASPVASQSTNVHQPKEYKEPDVNNESDKQPIERKIKLQRRHLERPVLQTNIVKIDEVHNTKDAEE